jgi:predicted nucleotidyltransferase component of viral defense system
MLDPDELADVGDAFGVDDAQVQRDHLISHLLHALSTLDIDGLLFFGGTALARTYLPNGRLSEDIDLSAPDRMATAKVLHDALPRALRREVPTLDWRVPLTSVRDTDPALLGTADGIQVRIQLLAAKHMFTWPAETRPIEMRYTDVPAAALNVPTLPAFAAMKTTAWADRHAERDLYDLNALADLGAIDQQAADLVKAATGVRVASHMFDHLPDDQQWQNQLAHQTRDLPSPKECLDAVRTAYARVMRWE